MRLVPGLLALALGIALAGCGGGKSDELSKATSEGPIGKGSSGVWLFRPAGKPKNVVVYFHGQGGPKEATPVNHLPWIKHLVKRGSIVIYPRYETAYEADPMKFVATGIKAAEKKVDVNGLPVLAIGYSRGGAIAVEYGAAASRDDLPAPDWILSVFPAPYGNMKSLIDLQNLPHFTELVILIGDRDQVVGNEGAVLLGRRLQRGGFPGENIQVEQIVSHGSFNANHFAPMDTSKAAQQAFWAPADRILDGLDNQ